MSNYYTPTIKEFVPGFKCETNYSLFCSDDSKNWIKIEFTKEILDVYMSAIEHDAYLTEFRVRIIE